MIIKLYTTHCPMCSSLERQLKKKNINFVECDDIEEMRSRRISSAPMLDVDGKLMDFTDAMAWVREQ